MSGKEFPLEVGQLWFIRPEHSHTFRSSKKSPLAFHNVALEAKAISNTFSHHPSLDNPWDNTPFPTSLKLNTYQRERFVSLIKEASTGPRGLLDAILFSLGLCHLLRPIERGIINSKLPTWLLEALPSARKPENIQLGLPQLVKLCGRSSEHVCRTFKSCLGQTPTEWLNKQRIAYARHLLETTQYPIIDIALNCGYESFSYFHRCFKTANGKTPLQYRNDNQKIQSAD